MAYLDDIYAVLQVAPTGVPTYVRLSQNENGRRMYFSVVGGEIPTGSTATISGTKPDGVVYSASCSINGSTVTVNETIQLTAAAGEWDAKLKIMNGGQTIATGRIRFVIDADTVAPGSVPSDSELEGLVAEAAGYAEAAKDAAYYGSPLMASTVAEMTDHNRVYVYTGSESGYTSGNWYFWDGSAWTSGGVYNATAVQTDKTLKVADMAADAKAVGDALAEVQVETDKTLTQADVPADAKAVGDELTSLKADLSDMQEEIDSFEGISDEVKEALLACFNHVIWDDIETGQSAYDDLYDALYGSKPHKAPYYDVSKMIYNAGGVAPAPSFTFNGSTRNENNYGILYSNTLANRARLQTVIPCENGTITANEGYEVCAYLFDDISFSSNWEYDPATDTRNNFGVNNPLNFYRESQEAEWNIPAWVSSSTIENSDCKYIMLVFRKTDNTEWTSDELKNMYGTVFTASLAPRKRLFDVATFKGGYSYTEGSLVKSESITEIGFTSAHTRKRAIETAAAARAVSGFLPIASGRFKSADETKYQLCVYQINFIGQIMWDANNPYISATNGNPAWSNAFDLSVSANKNDIFGVYISFKKLDSTEFTQEELSNMYGTVFTYEEV